MPNSLTGNFDVVAQAGERTVNRVLAALHQEGVFLHDFWTRIPPDEASPGTGLRGVAEVQLSTPAITVPSHGVATRIDVRFRVRARMKVLHPDSPAVPDFVHGELRARVDVDQVLSDSEEVISIDLRREDVDIIFVPDPRTTLPPEQAAIVGRVVEDFVRTGFDPVNVIVSRTPATSPYALRHWRFTALAPGPPRALALLFNLRDVAPAPDDPAGVRNVFLSEDDDFAIAVGRDFLLPELHTLVRNGLDTALPGAIRITIDFFFFFSMTAAYRIVDPSVEVELRPGDLWIRVAFQLRSSAWWAPSTRVTVGQAIALRVDRGSLVLERTGDIELRVGALFRLLGGGRIQREIENGIDAALSEGQRVLAEMLEGFTALLPSLRVPDPTVQYRSAGFQPDGAVVSGTLELPAWREVSARYTAAMLAPDPPHRPRPALELNALTSVIPGGTIERFRWFLGSERAVVREVVEEHPFFIVDPTLEGSTLPGCLWPPCRWCLEVQGTQGTHPDGRPRNVSGWFCNIVSGGIVDLPTGGRADLRVPVEVSDGRGGIVGHLDPRAGSIGGAAAVPRTSLVNLLVHFAGDGAAATLAEVSEALTRSGRRDDTAAVAVVPPPQKVQLRAVAGQAGIALAEDAEGVWLEAFQGPQAPATFLIDRDGKVAWQQVGQWNSQLLLQGLEALPRDGGMPRPRAVSLAAQPGDPAPDFVFPFLGQRAIALRQLRGRRVLLCFWTSWSEPSLEELRALQREQETHGRTQLVVLAVNDGEEPGRARPVLDSVAPGLHFVGDPQREIAQRYGIRCWPTTLTIDAAGRLEHVQFARSARG